jgi:hypothetical protein
VLSSILADALRAHFDQPLVLDGKTYRIRRPFRMTLLEEKDDHGEPDVSLNHDKYLAEP